MHDFLPDREVYVRLGFILVLPVVLAEPHEQIGCVVPADEESIKLKKKIAHIKKLLNLVNQIVMQIVCLHLGFYREPITHGATQ